MSVRYISKRQHIFGWDIVRYYGKKENANEDQNQTREPKIHVKHTYIHHIFELFGYFVEIQRKKSKGKFAFLYVTIVLCLVQITC